MSGIVAASAATFREILLDAIVIDISGSLGKRGDSTHAIQRSFEKIGPRASRVHRDFLMQRRHFIPIPLASHMEILTICLGSAKRYSVPSAKMSLPQDALPAELHACRGRSVPESNWEDRRAERSLEIRLISAGRTPSSKCG
jgi:hypothetical protein